MGKFGKTAELGFAIQGVEAFTGTLGKFIEVLEPVQLELFSIAVRDLSAEIGRVLMPIFKATIDIVKLLGDTVHALAPPIIKIVEACLEPLLKFLPEFWAILNPLFDALESLSSSLEAVMRCAMTLSIIMAKVFMMPLAALAEILIFLAPVIELVCVALEWLVDKFNEAVTWIMKQINEFFGLREPTRERGASTGTAVRAAQVGSIEDYGMKARQAAFSLGSGDPAKDTATHTKTISELLNELPDKLWSSMPEWIRTTCQAIGRFFDNITTDPGTRAAKAVGIDVPERTKGTWTALKEMDASAFLGSL